MEKISAIGIECSNRCNLTSVCRHCYGITGIADTNRIIELSDRVIEIIIKEISSIAKTITITGGEPTVYPQLVNRLVEDTGLPWMLMTNGIIWRKDFQPQAVAVSLDPNDIRPGVNPRRVIKNVLRYNCNLSINTVLSPAIDLFLFYDLLKDTAVKLAKDGHYISEWKLGFVVQKGYACKHSDIFVDWDTIFIRLREFLRVYFKERPFPIALRGSFFTKNISEEEDRVLINMTRNPCLDCFQQSKYMVINANGCVQFCSVDRNRVVPIKKSLINACIKVLQFPELTKLSYSDWKECCDCRWFRICGGGCPSLAETYGNGWTGKDVFQCEIMKRTEEMLLPVFPIWMQQIYSV